MAIAEDDAELIGEFVAEGRDALDAVVDLCLALESDPANPDLVREVFRHVHSVKGASSFLGLEQVETISHTAENLLVLARDGGLTIDEDIVGALLQAVDTLRAIFHRLETEGREGEASHVALLATLVALQDRAGAAPPSAASVAGPAAADPSVGTAAGATDAPAPPVTETSVRVDLSLLDRIVGLVGELVLTRNQLVQSTTDGHEPQQLGRRTQELSYITSALQEQALRTRMQRIENAWRSLPRVARDVAVVAGKQVRVEMHGEAIELDRTIIEAIRDPLVHLVRNAVDHGLEPSEARVAAGKDAVGTVRLVAVQDGGQVLVEVTDDGRGIDAARVGEAAVRKGIVTVEQVAAMKESEIIRLILAPGFSTASEVTTISGRGVGMDVVASNLATIRGTLDVVTELGAGTTFRLTIPLTLAIVPALIVTCDEQLYAIPQASVLELVRLHDDEVRDRIELIHDAPVLRLRERLLPLLDLRSVLGLEPGPSGRTITVVVVQSGDQPFGMLVDRVNKAEEIVVKPVSQSVQRAGAYAGATVMGDGSAALILDVAAIARRSGLATQGSANPVQQARHLEPAPTTEPVLTVRVGGRQAALPTTELERLETIRPDTVEWAGDTPVVQYRGRMLPLVFVADLLGEHRDPASSASLRVVVTSERRRRSVGLVVDQVLDVVDVERASLDVVGHAGAWAVVGSVVASGLVTELLDVPRIVAAHPGGHPDDLDDPRPGDARLAVA